jgi:alkylation response protein AidB-like acyl-CoA dehydrogenase
MSTTSTHAIPVPEPELTAAEMVDRARALVPVLRERQEECERLGRMPDETSRDFVEAGFYRILQPRRFGGDGVRLRLDRRLQLRKQHCAKMAYDAVNLMMRTNGSAGMRTGAMWQRYARDMTVLMTHNTVQAELAADSFGRMRFGLLPHGMEPGTGPAPPPVR